MASILVVEDEGALNDLIRTELETEGHQVRQARDGRSALQMVDNDPPQLVILDWMLPGLDGLSVCRQLRQRYLMPIIMLTARGEEVDRVLGLEVGADDYLVKPFSMRELLARSRAALRRVELEGRRSSGTSPQEPIVHGSLRVDPVSHRATIRDEDVSLTPKEFDLLLLFVSNPGRAFNREFLIERIWGDAYDGFDRAVDNHIRRLRSKLGEHGDKITTVWGLGYRFVP
ncbi:MAG TPA: response regulator transcription factor [Candidatus Acidoferrum sp.]|nr:response regulator transcription factor [Candidatus Acidoferrum sp.]